MKLKVKDSIEFSKNIVKVSLIEKYLYRIEDQKKLEKLVRKLQELHENLIKQETKHIRKNDELMQAINMTEPVANKYVKQVF